MHKKRIGLQAVIMVLVVVFAVHAKEDITAGQIPPDLDWPRVIDTPEAVITIYQPQMESFENNRLKGRFAASVQAPDMEEPVFGAVWVEAKMETRRDDRMAKLISLETVQSRFSNAKSEEEKWFADVLKKEIPTWDITLSIDQIVAGLEMEGQRLKTEQDLNNDPPAIIYVDYPAILVLVDGDPILKSIENTELKAVINTPFPIVFSEKDQTYYLIGKDSLYHAKEVAGKWQKTVNPPVAIAALQKEDTVDGEEPAPIGADMAVYGATKSTEILSIDGKPKFVSFPGNYIMYVENTSSDLLYEIISKNYYLLISGRWYVSQKFEGPWKYVHPEKVPQSFKDIPSDSEKSHLLASIPGTSEANEAILDAQIPETAVIKRSEASLTVEYDGEPEFEAIEGTKMDYAVNTSTPVIRVEKKYYAVDNGVWFVASKATGPWVVADSVPVEVQDIPSSSPVNNIKYVYIYDSTPDVVYVGYTPGYTGCYVYHGVVVYGTGYYYRPWYRYHYYPRPVTYGYSVHYNTYHGWSFGISYCYYGPYSYHHAYWGSSYYGWWGPRYYRPPYYRPPYYRPPGYRPPVATNPIERQLGSPSQLPSAGNLYDRKPDRTDNARPGTGDVKTTRPAAKPANLPNNVYADKEGNIYRRGENGWEQRQGNKWDKPSGKTPAVPSQTPSRPSGSIQQPSLRPSQPSTSQQRPSTGQSWDNRSRSLEQQHNSRIRGNQQTRQYQQNRQSMPVNRGSYRGGASPGAGRMR
jgi:hypothetical protein